LDTYCIYRLAKSRSVYGHPFPVEIKKERVRATLNFMIIRKPIRALSIVFSLGEKETFTGAALSPLGITSPVTCGTIFSHYACDLNSGASNRP